MMSKSRSTTNRRPRTAPRHVPANRISAIVAGKRSITGETALRLGRYFGTAPAYWMNMQARYDLETARDEWEARIQSDVRPRNAA
jgi:plasmid maintenance system antidote protein VapI